MANSFKAYRAFQTGDKVACRIVDQTLADLADGNVTVKIAYSSINYKDALGATGKGKIYKTLPITGGIDGAGVVETSNDRRFIKGDPVLVTGCGFGESHDGGYAEYQRLPGDWLVPLPPGLSLRESMILGTAGFTAALCLHRLEQNGQTPDLGPIVVTGATGGVGSLAVSMLAARDYEVIAVTGKPKMESFLHSLGAHQVTTIKDLELGSRPLESVKFGGAIDNVGGEVLAGLLRSTNLWGNVASVGLAGGAEFKATVMPHILRGVSLLGISSTNCPMPLRHKLWQRLASDLKPPKLDDHVSATATFDDLDSWFHKMLNRQTHGRILVQV